MSSAASFAAFFIALTASIPAFFVARADFLTVLEADSAASLTCF